MEIGFAIIGSGMIANFHAEAIRQVPSTRLIASYSRNAATNTEFATKQQCAAAISLEEIAANPAIHAVCITTPSGAHALSAVPMLEAGKAVLCEKPMEVSLEAVDQIIAASQRSGALLAGVFQNRLGIGAGQLKAAVESGRFGRLTSCSAYIKWWRAQSYYTSSSWKGTLALDGGGALMNQGIHAVDLLQWLVGLPKEVCAFSDTLAHPGVEAEDTLVACLRFPSGALGVIEAATSAYPGLDLRIEIIGDKGTAILVNDKITKWEFADALAEDEAIRSGQESGKIGGGTADPKAISVEGHRRLVADLADAIRDGRQPMIPGAEARKAIQLVLACYEAAKTGRAVSLQ